METPTVHNSAKYGDIAETILLPGDPLRAQFIAENFLSDVIMYTKIRGILGFTGTYKGVRISVQGTGMGGPSIGIYSYELIHSYGVKKLIRIGSAGAIQEHLHLGDLIGVTAACYDTDYTHQLQIPGTISPAASFYLLQLAYQQALQRNQKIHIGTVLSSDVFYSLRKNQSLSTWKELGVLAVEMEAASLFLTAQAGRAEAMCLLTISDLIFSDDRLSANERERSLIDMITLGLDVAVTASLGSRDKA